MPLTVITLKNCPLSLRGDLTKWMQEISTGVYIGNFNSKIREKLRERVVDSVGIGEATMSYAYRNEIGYNFQTHNCSKIPINFDGIPLVLSPKKISSEKLETKHGFSKASKIRKAKKYSTNSKLTKENTRPYVIIDLETSGLDSINDRIMEIAAIKVSKETKVYSCFVKQDIKLSQTIKNLTGLDEDQLKNGKKESEAINELVEFVGNHPIVGYNINFDLKFINEALKRQSKNKIPNKTYDLMKYVKNEKIFLNNYKLETVLKEYGIEEKIPHRALADAKIIQKLLSKIDELASKLNS